MNIISVLCKYTPRNEKTNLTGVHYLVDWSVVQISDKLIQDVG